MGLHSHGTGIRQQYGVVDESKHVRRGTLGTQRKGCLKDDGLLIELGSWVEANVLEEVLRVCFRAGEFDIHDGN